MTSNSSFKGTVRIAPFGVFFRKEVGMGMFTRSKRHILKVTATIAVGFAILVPNCALAEIEVCNRYRVPVFVAIGWVEGGDTSTEGWWRVNTGQCVTVDNRQLLTPYYLYAETKWRTVRRGTKTRNQWGNGGNKLAVGSGKFKYVHAQKIGPKDTVADFLNLLTEDNRVLTSVTWDILADGKTAILAVRSKAAAAPTPNAAGSVQQIRAEAEQGDAKAQYNLGEIYYKGQGVPQDHSQAAAWWRKAAEQGDAMAQTNLGVMYYKGQGVPQDYSQAVAWYRKAAEQGYAIAQSNLGGLYVEGQGVPQDYSQAAAWWRKAAEQGHAQAQLNLGKAYENGDGVSKDLEEARYWYQQAASNKLADEELRNEATKARDAIDARSTLPQPQTGNTQANQTSTPIEKPLWVKVVAFLVIFGVPLGVLYGLYRLVRWFFVRRKGKHIQIPPKD